MKIVINRSDAIGDTLLTLPMAQFLKDKYPKSKITFIVSPKSKDLFVNHQFVDEVWILDHKQNRLSQFFSLWKRMAQEKIDIYFHVGGSSLPSLVAFMRRIKFRGGLIHKLPGILFLNQGVRQSRSMVEMHEVEYNLNLLKTLDIPFIYSERERVNPGIQLLSEEMEESRKSLLKIFPERDSSWPYVVIHPGMTGHTLNWSPRNYARFIEKFEKSFPNTYHYIISYTPSDERYIKDFRDELELRNVQEIKDKIFFLDGSKVGLRRYMGILGQASFYLGPSTGPTHLANFLGIKQVVIYSPIKVQSAYRWGPYVRKKGQVSVVVPEVVCGETFKCAKSACPYYECMGKVEVDFVTQKAVKLLTPAKEKK